jgi:hypothetical protein
VNGEAVGQGIFICMGVRQVGRQICVWTDRQVYGKTDGQGKVRGLADG